MSNEINDLARDFGQVPAKLANNITKIVPRTGLAMKKRMQADFRASKAFKPVAQSVDYEVTRFGFGGDASIQVEIGVNMERGIAPGLNHIAYFGDSKGGGATVPDPVVPMRLEAPVFYGFMEMAAEGLL